VTPTRPASRTPGSTQRSTRGLRWFGGAVGLLVGCLLVSGCQGGGGEPPAEATSTRPVRGERAEVGRPVSISIPAAGVDARVVPVGLRADRTMEVPEVDLAGWYEPGPRPGDAGPAVIVGHVDSRDGPAVFFRLGELRPGDRIEVGQQGGGGRSFVVERVERRPKEALPAGRIWNRTREPVLRLITCGGSFDRSAGHYRDNIIVCAEAIP
jgi:sortase (surface protein transpeptidase)